MPGLNGRSNDRGVGGGEGGEARLFMMARWCGCGEWMVGGLGVGLKEG